MPHAGPSPLANPTLICDTMAVTFASEALAAFSAASAAAWGWWGYGMRGGQANKRRASGRVRGTAERGARAPTRSDWH